MPVPGIELRTYLQSYIPTHTSITGEPSSLFEGLGHVTVHPPIVQICLLVFKFHKTSKVRKYPVGLLISEIKKTV